MARTAITATVRDPDLEIHEGLHAVEFTKKADDKTSSSNIEHLTTAELAELAAACELRLASAEGRGPAIVIRLSMPVHEEGCGEAEKDNYSPGEWVRMAGSSAQLAGIALKFIAMPGILPAVQHLLTNVALDEEGLTDTERLNGVAYARDLNPRVLRQLSSLYLSFSEQTSDGEDEAAGQAS